MILECRWCGSDRSYGEPCDACPCPIDVNEVILAKLSRLESQPRAPVETAPASDRMTSHEAAGFYRFPSVKALWMATQRHPTKYPHERRGRRILYIRPAPKR